MSVYGVHKLLWSSEWDPDLRARLQNKPVEAFEGFPLTDEEKQALLRGDVGKLYRMGVHAFMLRYIPMHRLFGVTPEIYRDRISQETPRVTA